MSPNFLGQKGDGMEHWTAPCSGSIKVNVDAVLFEEEVKFGVGLVVRDERDFLREGCTILLHGKTESVIAEAVGIQEALSWIKAYSGGTAIVETDCLVAVQAIRSNIELGSLFGDIIQECKVLLRELSDVSIIFIRRSANVVAYEFARASILYPDPVFKQGMSRLYYYTM